MLLGFNRSLKNFDRPWSLSTLWAVLLQGTPEEHVVVIQWSRFKNTVTKLSAILSTSTYPHRDVGAVIKKLADAYGPDCMIYGGGFGADATPQSYGAVRERTRATIAHLSDDDQTKVLGGTSAKLFGFSSYMKGQTT